MPCPLSLHRPPAQLSPQSGLMWVRLIEYEIHNIICPWLSMCWVLILNALHTSEASLRSTSGFSLFHWNWLNSLLRIEIDFPFPYRIMSNVLRNDIYFQFGPYKKGMSVLISEVVVFCVSPFQLVEGVNLILDVIEQFDACGFLLLRDFTDR